MHPVSTLDELITSVRRYRPSEILKACHTYSLRCATQNHRPLDVSVDEVGVTRVIRVAPYSLGLIARLALLHGSELVVGGLDERHFRRILAKVADLYEPMAAVPLLIRTGYEQGWYQEDIKRALARAVVMYRDIPATLDAPEFDLGAEFEALCGLSVDEFLGLSFLAFSKMSAPDGANVFLTTVRPQSMPPQVTRLWTRDKLARLLSFCATDIAGYRSIAASNPAGRDASARYAFNPLFSRPIIDLGPGGHVAPLPDLLIWRAEWAPYWELREAHRQDGITNDFATFFGKEIFERYIGLQLEDSLSAARRFSEGETSFRTGRGESAGPDWIAIQEDQGLAVECTIGSVPVVARTDGDVDQVERALRIHYAPRMNKLPEKVAQTTRMRRDLGLADVRRWHYVVVYKESIPFLGFLRPKLLDPHLSADGRSVHLMSISEFENLVAVEGTLGVMSLLQEKAANPAWQALEFREFLHEITVSRGVGAANQLLATAQNDFLSALGVP